MASWILFAVIIPASQIAALNRFLMDENPTENQPNDEALAQAKEQPARGWGILWLMLAFVPSFLALLMGSALPGSGPILFWLGLVCCLVAGLGIVGEIKNIAVRILAGLFLAIVFFVLNVIIVVLIGCSTMGHT